MTKLRLFVLLFGLCCWPQLFAYAEERMRIGISAVSLGFLPTVLAEKKGLYTKYGLLAEHVLVPCAIATNALLSEDLDYAVCTGPGIAGAIKGLPIKLIMTTQDKLGYLLLVKPNIQKLTDLRGKTIGISTFGSQLYLTSVTLFRKAGMETGKDVIFCPPAITTRGSPRWRAAKSTRHLFPRLRTSSAPIAAIRFCSGHATMCRSPKMR